MRGRSPSSWARFRSLEGRARPAKPAFANHHGLRTSPHRLLSPQFDAGSAAQIGQTQILWPPAKWHTLCPPLSILFILGAVSPADDAAVMRERDLLQLRANSLHGLGQTSRFCGDDASSGRLFRKKAALTKAPSPFFFKKCRAPGFSVFTCMYVSSLWPPGRAWYRRRKKPHFG